LEGGVQPAEQGFAFGIDFVIDFHGRPGVLAGGENALEPVLQTRAVARGNFQQFGPRKSLAEFLAQTLQSRWREQIALVDHDEVGFFELLAVNIAHLVGEVSPVRQTENPQRPDWIHQNAERSNGKIIAIHPAQRVGDRGNEVSATADGFRDKDLRSRFGGQFFRRFRKGIEPAAKATAGNLFHCEAPSREDRRINEPITLVVGDQSNPQPLLAEALGEPDDRRGFARAQKTADHYVAGFVRCARDWALVTQSRALWLGRLWTHLISSAFWFSRILSMV